jgi:hypothetical protein
MRCESKGITFISTIFYQAKISCPNLINVPMLVPVMGVNSTEAFRGSRACFHRFRYAIARRRVGHKRIEQMLCDVSDIIDGTIERCLVCLGRFRETAQLSDELKRRSANLVVRRGWTEVMKCFDGSAHVRIINNSRLTINYFVFR